MAANLTELARTNLTTTTTTVINSGTSESVFIGQMAFTNNGSVNRTVEVWILESGDTATTDNRTAVKTILPNKSWICQECLGQTIIDGSFVQSSVDAGTDVRLVASGVVET